MKKTVLSVLAIVMGISFSLFANEMVAASSEPVFAEKQYATYLPEADYTSETVNRKLVFHDYSADFVNSGVGIVYKTKIEGETSVEFSILSNEPFGKNDMYFVFNKADYAAATKPLVAETSTYFVRDGEKIIGNKATVCDAEGNPVSNPNTYMKDQLGAFAVGELLYKIVIRSDGNLELYYDFASAASPLTTLRNILKIEGNEDFSKTNGYFAIVPTEAAGITYDNELFINYVKIGDKTFDFSDGMSEEWAIVGDENMISFDYPMTFANANGKAEVVSKFEVAGADAEESEIVFDLTFDVTRKPCSCHGNGYLGNSWGMKFGINETTPISDAYFLRLSNTETALYKGSEKITEYTKGEVTGSENDLVGQNMFFVNVPMTLRITATAGGEVKLYRGITYQGNEVSKIEEVLATYSGIDVSGKIAFVNYVDETHLGDGNTAFSNVRLNAFEKNSVLSVTLNKGMFAAVNVGDEIKLSADVETKYENGNTAVKYEFEKGAELVELSGDTLKAKSEGIVKLICRSVEDPDVFDFVEFEIKKYDFEYTVLNDDFNSLNNSNWTVDFTETESRKLQFSGGLYFYNDFLEDGYNGGRVISNFRYTIDNKKDVVFDISFKMMFNNEGYRKNHYSFGFMFGMNEQNDLLNDDNVGYFNMFVNRSEVYFGGKKVEPTFGKGYDNEGYMAYADPSGGAVIFRLVGKKDGSLDVYRQQAGYGNLTDVFATYSGLNFNGYVGFTTNTSKESPTDSFAFGLFDYKSTGSVVIPKEYKIDSVNMSREGLNDAIVSDTPLILSANVNSTPNLQAFHGVRFEVVSGNAEITDGNKLIIKAAGDITIKAYSSLDEKIFDEVTFNAIKLVVNKIVVNSKAFENLNIFSQPVKLVATVDCNSYSQKHQAVTWETLTSNVEIAGNFLRIKGAGEAKIKVTSVYDPSVSEIITFVVEDDSFGQKGCNAQMAPSEVLGLICLLSVVILIGRKTGKKHYNR